MFLDHSLSRFNSIFWFDAGKTATAVRFEQTEPTSVSASRSSTTLKQTGACWPPWIPHTQALRDRAISRSVYSQLHPFPQPPLHTFYEGNDGGKASAKEGSRDAATISRSQRTIRQYISDPCRDHKRENTWIEIDTRWCTYTSFLACSAEKMYHMMMMKIPLYEYDELWGWRRSTDRLPELPPQFLSFSCSFLFSYHFFLTGEDSHKTWVLKLSLLH